MTPIETHYNGYRFRSRLEARFAVFFDAAEIPWEYEKEGYALPSGWYLPDFWIPYTTLGRQAIHYPDGHPPYAGVWIEIKAGIPTEEALIKLAELSKATGHNAYLIGGLPIDGTLHVWMSHPEWPHAKEIQHKSFLLRIDSYRTNGAKLLYWNDELDDFAPNQRAMDALYAARAARFERGA